MYGPFGLELAKIRIDELHAEAVRRKGDGPAPWRRAAGRVLIYAGARLGRIRVLSVQPRVERGQA
jgi:hypothetical protein